jgi:hypothetical protein
VSVKRTRSWASASVAVRVFCAMKIMMAANAQSPSVETVDFVGKRARSATQCSVDALAATNANNAHHVSR